MTLTFFLLIILGPFCINLLIMAGLVRRPISNIRVWSLFVLYLAGCVVLPFAIGLGVPEVRDDPIEMAALVFLIVVCRAIDLKGFGMWAHFRHAKREKY